MCGFVGYHLVGQEFGKIDQEILVRMASKILHRGPDSTGIICSDSWGMAHNRLSIIDLNEGANQPMRKFGLCMSYNGEIYNYKEIRKELEQEGYSFATNSDTEVVLTAFQHWREGAFIKFNGIFSLAIYNESEKEFILCRDRLGIKPLYIYKKGGVILFGSEIKSFLPSNLMDKDLNRQVALEFIWMSSPAGEDTIYSHVKKLKPGSWLRIDEMGGIVERQYYEMENMANQNIDDKMAQENILKRLDSAVERQMVSDVPICIFLSGGVDSAALTLLAARHSAKKLNTFSVEFDFYKKGGSELPKAKIIASLAESNHNEVHINSDNLRDTVQKLVYHHDEPFGDTGNIPLFLLSEMIKGQYKVVLQGDGGDELFGGYTHYQYLNKGMKWRNLALLANPILSKIDLNSPVLNRYKRAFSYIGTSDKAQMMSTLVFNGTGTKNPGSIFSKDFMGDLTKMDPFKELRTYLAYKDGSDLLKYLNTYDMLSVLPNLFLEKVDKATMANSVEARVPFLDFDLVDYAVSLPFSQRFQGGESKYLLKKSLQGLVPDEILYGKKQGFSVPYASWLKTGLNDLFHDTINSQSFKEAGIFKRDKVIQLMKEHEQGQGINGNILWHVLMFGLWHKEFMTP